MDKYNQLPQKATDKSPHQLLYKQDAPQLTNLYIFGQLGYVPIMNKADRNVKCKNRGSLVRYPGRDEPRHIFAETPDGAIKRHRAKDFHPYYTERNPHARFSGTL